MSPAVCIRLVVRFPPRVMSGVAATVLMSELKIMEKIREAVASGVEESVRVTEAGPSELWVAELLCHPGRRAIGCMIRFPDNTGIEPKHSLIVL